MAELRSTSFATEARAVDASRALALGVASAAGGSECRVVSAFGHAVHLTAFEFLAALAATDGLVGAVARVANGGGLVSRERRSFHRAFSGRSGFGKEDVTAEAFGGVGEHGDGRDHADTSVLLAEVDGGRFGVHCRVDNGNSGFTTGTVGHGIAVFNGFRDINVVCYEAVVALQVRKSQA